MADRRRFAVPGPRVVYVAILAVMVAEIALAPLPRAVHVEPPRTAPDPRFPELADVDREVLALVRSWRSLGWRRTRVEKIEQYLERERTAKESGPGIRQRIIDRGAEAARAILYVLIEAYRKPEDADGVIRDTSGLPRDDGSFERTGMMLGELADAEVRKLLVRALPLREFHPAFRRSVVVALCQPQHAAALSALVDCVLDRHEERGFRCGIMLRLHRVGVTPPERLRALLYQPFENLDILTAAALARMGDPEAPSLVLAGLKLHIASAQVAAAANWITGREHAFDPTSTTVENPSGNWAEDWYRARAEQLRPHREELERWLATAPETEFERLQKAQPRLQSFDEVLAAGDDFDLADAALLLTGCDEEMRRLTLRRLDNLAHFLRGQLAGVADPEARIRILNECCLPRSRARDHRPELDYTFLPTVFQTGQGNCLGFSTLYVALGQRLGLPLYGVASPNHCFVRYDDGAFRRNIETTDGGVAKPDDYYFGPEARARAPGVIERGVFLANLSRRGMLAAVLANRSAELIHDDRFEEAIAAAKRAVVLEPLETEGRHDLAWALFRADPANERRVLEEFGRVLDLWPADVFTRRVQAECLLHYGHPARALAELQRVREIDDSLATLKWLAVAQARADNVNRALALLEEPLREHPDDFGLRVAELEARLREDPRSAHDLVPLLGEATGEPLRIRAAAARVLLDTGHARLALDVLAPAREAPVAEEDCDGKREYYRAYVRALHACGQRGEARAEFERLCEFHPDDFYLKTLRRTLDGG